MAEDKMPSLEEKICRRFIELTRGMSEEDARAFFEETVKAARGEVPPGHQKDARIGVEPQSDNPLRRDADD